MSTATELQRQELQSQEDAAQLANEINRLEAALKQMKDEIENLCESVWKCGYR